MANHGQAPATVRYMAQGPELTAYFSSDAVLFRLGGRTVTMRLEGASRTARVEGIDRLPGRVNFLTGAESSWRTGESIYGGVIYRGLYPGIDMVYNGTSRNLKSEFHVAPGADPARIRVRYEGAGALRISQDGALILPLGDREFREDAPVIYQVRGGMSQQVSGRYHLASDGAVGFVVGEYDRTLPLIIDPVVYSTLLGGASTDAGNAIAVDAAGSAYITGFTASLDFPTMNPAQNASGGSNDIFVAKLNTAGNGLVYCTYLGSKGDDRAFAIAVDSTGAAYITGSTTSTAFPMRNPLQSKLQGTKDAFVVKLSPEGNTTVFSTYLGGSGSEVGNGIAVDSAGNVYVTGDTASTNFPATGYQRTLRGGQDAFLVKLSPAGSPMLYGTYLGGSYDDHSSGLAVDASGSVCLAGSTSSTDFPVAAAAQSQSGGSQDAFVACFDPTGASLLFSTYLGGSGGSLTYPEAAMAITLDPSGNAYVAGTTSSADFPLRNPSQSVRRGSLDGFITKFSPSGTILASTYFGGAGVDVINAIAVDAAGNQYIAGQTLSTDLPIAAAFQSTNGGQYDAFVAKLAASGSVSFLSYLGGNGADTATGIALDGSGNLYLTGWSQSTNFPVLSGYQTINAGTYGAFITKVTVGVPPSAVSVTPNSGSGASQTFSFVFSNSTGAADLTTVSALFHTTTSNAGGCSITYNRAANTLALLTDAGAVPTTTITPGSGTAQNSQCVLNGAGSSVSISGTNLTLNLAITFQAAFSGAKNIYMQAATAGGATGWQLKGSWTVAAGPPQPVSVTPGSGSGSTQTFSFLFTDPRGYAAINTASLIIGTSLSGANSCYMYYARAANTIYLANDAGTAWGSSAVLGSSSTIQNAQCSLSASGSSVSGSGNDLTLNLAITFKSAYAGAKTIYMEVHDGLDSGWISKGSWTVVDNGPPTPLSVDPASGSGAAQTFTFQFSSPRGYATISTTSIIFGTSASGVNSCYLYFPRTSNAIYLANDAGSAWLTPATLGSSVTVENSQCSVSAASSSSSGSGNVLTLTLAITFKPAYAGARTTYMQVSDGQNSGWVVKGSWTVTLANVFGPVSATPASGSGSSQTFSLLFNDPAGYTNISSASVIVGTSTAAANTCYLYYARATNSIYLANDAGNAWLTPAVLGASTTIQNNQCSINVAASSSSGSGTELTLNLALTFKLGYTGSKSIYLLVYNTQSSGWQSKGTWIVP